MQASQGKETSDNELAAEMTRRTYHLPKNRESLTRNAYDSAVESDFYFARTIAEKRLAFANLLRAHGFQLGSMRLNSRHIAGLHGNTIALHWALSDTERKEFDGCLEIYRHITNSQKEAAKLAPKRSRSKKP